MIDRLGLGSNVYYAGLIGFPGTVKTDAGLNVIGPLLVRFSRVLCRQKSPKESVSRGIIYSKMRPRISLEFYRRRFFKLMKKFVFDIVFVYLQGSFSNV